MQAAKAAGLPVPNTELSFIGDRPVFIVERYDRSSTPSDNSGNKDIEVTRIHQEDACQAMGIMPDRKYENDGGPSFADPFYADKCLEFDADPRHTNPASDGDLQFSHR